MKSIHAFLILLVFVAAVLGLRYISVRFNLAERVFPRGLTSWNVSTSTYARPYGYIEYQSIEHYFSLQYPPNLKVTEYNEEGGARTITFKDKTSDKGFQIFIVPYKEEHISPERFKLDVPSGVMLEPTEILVDGTRASMFFSQNAAMGETREVWFIHRGYLFEVTTYKAQDAWLSDIMRGWKFF